MKKAFFHKRRIPTMALSIKLVFGLLVPLLPCLEAEESKACYGIPGPPCTRHRLICSSGLIDIQNAFFTNSTVCGKFGVTSCMAINLSYPLTCTRYNFTTVQLGSLYGNCSTQSECSLKAGRIGTLGVINFSVIQYQCINESNRTTSTWTTATQGTTRTSTSVTSSTSSTVVPSDKTTNTDLGSYISRTTTSVSNRSTDSKVQKGAESNTGTIVGIIVPLCIIIAGVVTAVIIFRRRKLRQKGENGKVVKPEPNQQEVYSLGKKFSPEYDYATTNEYLDLVPQTHKMRSPQCGDADDNLYHQVELLQTKAGLPESSHSSGNKNNKLNLQSSVRDCTDTNYHELEPQTELGSSEYNLASTIDSHNGKSQPGNKGSSEYVLAENISKRGTESQQAMKGSSAYDYTGDNTYHVLERQLALRDSSDEAYEGGNDYHEVEPQDSNTSDYDYASCGDKQVNHSSSRNIQTRDSDYDHFGCQPVRANGHYDTTVSVAERLEGGNDKEEVYSYNHLNEKTSSTADVDSTYNTTASTRHNLDASTNEMEDDYGYNHLGTDSKKNLPQNEYDTTASAIRDLARMNGDMEDSTYDHAYLLTSDCSPSEMTNAGFQESDYDHA